VAVAELWTSTVFMLLDCHLTSIVRPISAHRYIDTTLEMAE